MPAEIDNDAKDQIIESLFGGRKIEAIKLYREATGEGLKEAKDFVETLAARLREEHPEKFSAEPAGCGAAVLLITAALLGAASLIVA